MGGFFNYKVYVMSRLLLIPALFLLLISANPPAEGPRIHLIGDSTMAEKKAYDRPETGWGEAFGLFFRPEVQIFNHAVNGRSTLSFRSRGEWDKAARQIKPQDYVFIQFGHNDAKESDPERYAPARTAYRENLIRYIDEVEKMGAIPVLCTPVNRRQFDDAGKAKDSHGDYPVVVREVAQLKKVALLDLHTATMEMLNELGTERSKLLFVHLLPGYVPKHPEGLTDNTHFTPYGARMVATLAARLLMDQVHPLRNFLKKSVFPNNYEYQLPQVCQAAFKPDTFDIRKYGAERGAVRVNTQAIQTAIDNAANLGGGVVRIPKGLWVTGPIVLKSNINLHLEQGALLQFSDDRSLYPIVETTWEGQKAYRCQAPISARNAVNIGITGAGTIDGSGHVWKSVKRSKLTESQWKNLVESGGVHDGSTWYPSESSRIGHASEWAKKITPGKTMQDYESVKDFLRPNMVSLIECTVVLIEGVTFNNSPAWTLHPLLCWHTTVRNVKVTNPWYGQNNDAIDLESCRYGILDQCTFDTGDDAITLKSGRDEEGRRRGVPTDNFIITNTTVFHGHGGFVIGSEMSGGVRNIYVNGCNFLGTDIGLRFKTTRGRGGMVQDIFVSDIQMSEIVGEAILFDMYYAAKDPIPLVGDQIVVPNTQPEPVTEATPEFRNFYFERISCKGARSAITMNGLPEKNVDQISILNSSLKATKGIVLNDVSNINLVNVEVIHQEGPLLQIHNSKNVTFDNVQYAASVKAPIGVISGKLTSGIRFKNTPAPLRTELFHLDKSIEKKVLSFN